MYGKDSERMWVFTLLGVVFDSWVTQAISDKIRMCIGTFKNATGAEENANNGKFLGDFAGTGRWAPTTVMKEVFQDCWDYAKCQRQIFRQKKTTI